MRARGLTALCSTIGVAAAALVCGAAPAMAKPLHVLYPGHYGSPPTTSQCVASNGIACYAPYQFQRAYDMWPLYNKGLTGAGKTIVLVDSYGSPTIASDLATFDKAYKLPAPPSFKVIQPDGPVPPFNPANGTEVGWAEETSLDVEYSHTMAPGANILLVETPIAETEGVHGFPEIVEAENYVINHGLGDVISQSFGATEQTFPSRTALLALRGAYENAEAHGVTVLASTGDTGAANYEKSGASLYPFKAVGWPASDPLVTAVGGTQLHLNNAGARTAPDNVWNDGNLCGSIQCAGSGGVSAVFSRPFYQDGVAGVVGAQRGIPDISMSAAVNGGALVYMSFGGIDGPGYYIIGGTSEASPEFSGIVAVADQAAGHDLGLLNPSLYAIGDGPSSGIVDITLGNNTVTLPTGATLLGYNAVPGYDLASGLGTSDGAQLVAALAAH